MFFTYLTPFGRLPFVARWVALFLTCHRHWFRQRTTISRTVHFCLVIFVKAGEARSLIAVLAETIIGRRLNHTPLVITTTVHVASLASHCRVRLTYLIGITVLELHVNARIACSVYFDTLDFDCVYAFAAANIWVGKHTSSRRIHKQTQVTIGIAWSILGFCRRAFRKFAVARLMYSKKY